MISFFIGLACGCFGLMIAACAFSPAILPKPPRPDYPVAPKRDACPVCKASPVELERITLFGKSFDACKKCGAVAK